MAAGGRESTDGTFDVVVIGAGTAGEVVAGRLTEAGLAVAVVEREPDGVRAQCLTSRGITLVRGHARLAGDRAVAVEDGDGARGLVARRAVVLATGSRPARPPVPGLDDVGARDHCDMTTPGEIPRSLVVLGGAAVGLETAQTVKRRGTRSVTVLETEGSLLAQEEPFAGAQVRAALESEGIVVAVSARVERVGRAGPDGRVRVHVAGGRVFEADELLVATGRTPNTDDVGLGTVGLEPGLPVPVDDTFAVEGVDGGRLYAVGDCNGRSPLTHMAQYQARVVSDVLVGRPARDRAADVVPRVVLTDPQVAAVGLTAAQARARGLRVTVLEHGTAQVAGAGVPGRDPGGTSLLVVDDEDDVVVGATFTGRGVQELLHAATVAIAGRVPLTDLWHAVPAHPTASEVWLRLLEQAGL